MHKNLKEPHILLASSNPYRVIKNLNGVLSAAELAKIQSAIDSNALALLSLGESHYNFAKAIPSSEWRQKVSRFYYAVYNVRRAVSLRHDGSFSTDSSDHNNVDQIPEQLEGAAIYKSKFRNLRDDRNLADYSHLATEADLLISVVDAENLATNFIIHAKNFLTMIGMTV